MLQADEEDDAMDQQMKSPFGSSFRTFDATDYKPISRRDFLCVVWMSVCFQNHSSFFLLSATVDVKRNIFDLCTDTKDCYLAVIEVRLARHSAACSRCSVSSVTLTGRSCFLCRTRTR